MRKLIMAVLLASCFCLSAQAAVTTATFGDQNASKQYRMVADSDGVITLGTNTAMASMSMITGPVVALSASNTVMSSANIVKNAIFQASPSTSATYTIDTGANLTTAVVPVANETIPFVVTNSGAGYITLNGSTGMTLSGAFTVPALTNKTLYATYLGSSAWTVN